MIRNLFHIIIFSTIFIASYVFFKQPFEGYITYIVLVLLFPVFISKFGIPIKPLLIFFPLLISGIIYMQSGDNTPQQFWKVFIGFSASVIFYEYVLKLYSFDVRRLFKYYMIGCYIASMIGIFQVLSFLVGFTPGYDFRWVFNKWNLSEGGLGIRMNSIFSEPAYFAAVCAPAFFIALYSLIKNRAYYLKNWQLIAIVLAYFLTFSTLGYLGIFFCLVLLLVNLGFIRYALIFGPLAVAGFVYAYTSIDEFRDRIDGTREVFVEGNIQSYDVHGSSFVLYNSYIVATTNWKKNPMFGTGLGSHAMAFERYSVTKQVGAIQIEFNQFDANSMFLRLLSETGLYGVLFMLIFLIRSWVRRNRAADEEMWLISNAVLVIILLYLSRQGHYFLNGFPFFLWMFYYVSRENKDLVAEHGYYLSTDKSLPSFSGETPGESLQPSTSS